MRRRRQRHPEAGLRGEAGTVGGVEVLGFGLLAFVIGTLVVANAWGVVDATLAASAAAREGARAAAESGAADLAGAGAEAVAAARDAVAGHGRDPARAEVAVGGEFRRCGRVTVSVSYDVPLTVLPWIGGGGVVRASGSHSEVVDPYRDDVPGDADLGAVCGA